MESLGTTRRLIGKFLLILLLVATAWAGYKQYRSPLVRALADKSDTSIYVAILTQPALVAAYNPHSQKAVLSTINRRKIPDNPLENAQDLFQVASLSVTPVRYYVPVHNRRNEYWENFRADLTQWRTKPFIAARVLWNYLQALHDKRTNLTPSEFILLAMDGTRLELTDFTVKNLTEEKQKKTSKHTGAEPDAILPPVEDKAPLAVEDRPLVLEILNASGVKGAALELTQYLRDQNQKGLLNVDVLQYDNFPGERQAQTQIIDYTGRRALIKQLSTAIGVNNEIISEKQGTAICDARIIIGQDFKQPL